MAWETEEHNNRRRWVGGGRHDHVHPYHPWEFFLWPLYNFMWLVYASFTWTPMYCITEVFTESMAKFSPFYQQRCII